MQIALTDLGFLLRSAEIVKNALFWTNSGP